MWGLGLSREVETSIYEDMAKVGFPRSSIPQFRISFRISPIPIEHAANTLSQQLYLGRMGGYGEASRRAKLAAVQLQAAGQAQT